MTKLEKQKKMARTKQTARKVKIIDPDYTFDNEEETVEQTGWRFNKKKHWSQARGKKGNPQNLRRIEQRRNTNPLQKEDLLSLLPENKRRSTLPRSTLIRKQMLLP